MESEPEKEAESEAEDKQGTESEPEAESEKEEPEAEIKSETEEELSARGEVEKAFEEGGSSKVGTVLNRMLAAEVKNMVRDEYPELDLKGRHADNMSKRALVDLLKEYYENKE